MTGASWSARNKCNLPGPKRFRVNVRKQGTPMSMNRRHFLKHVAGYSASHCRAWSSSAPSRPTPKRFAATTRASSSCGWAAARRRSISGTSSRVGPTGGEFREIYTSAYGVKICEHMPKVAEQIRHLNVIRSLSTTEGDHMRGTQLMHTAFTPNPAIAFPSMGAVASKKARSSPATRHQPAELHRGRQQWRRPRLPRHELRPVQRPATPAHMPENIRAPAASLGDGIETRIASAAAIASST